MNALYYLLFTLFDVLPWIFFQIAPFYKNDIKLSNFKFSVIIIFVIIYKFIIAYLNSLIVFTPITLFFIQTSSTLLTIILAICLISSNKYKILFIFLLTLPASSLTTTMSKFVIENFIFDKHPYLIMLLVRFISTSVISYIYYLFWKKYFTMPIPYVVKKENELWNYAWIIPAILVLISVSIYMIDVLEGRINIYDLFVQGLLCFAMLCICALFFDCLKYARENINHRIESEKLEILFNLQQKNSNEILADFERIKKNNHDFRHHLATLNTYVKNEKFNETSAYIDDLMNMTNEYQPHFFCENMAVNATLVSHFKKAQDNDIKIEYKISIPNNSNVSDVDLSVLFGNLIENAIDACVDLPIDKRNIIVKGRIYEDKIYLIFENNCRIDRIKPNKLYYSSKRNYETTGIGLLTVRNIVDKYSGDLDINYNDGVFIVKIILNT